MLRTSTICQIFHPFGGLLSYTACLLWFILLTSRKFSIFEAIGVNKSTNTCPILMSICTQKQVQMQILDHMCAKICIHKCVLDHTLIALIYNMYINSLLYSNDRVSTCIILLLLYHAY